MHGMAIKQQPKAWVQKQRFATLDAMRGVAALVVVYRHIALASHTYVPRFSYLAVDLFFVLSGFVLAFSYDKRLREGMGIIPFLKKRILRLAPLYLLGLVVGVLCLLIVPGKENNGPERVAIETALNGLGLPSPYHGSFGSPFPINAVFWSLFFELWIANVAFVTFWKLLHGWRLFTLIALCALALLVCEKVWYTMDVGPTWQTFAGGFARVGFSFFAGVAVARLHRVRPPRLRIPSWACLVATCAVFFIPLEARASHAFELLAIFAVFPVAIFLGAEAVERRPEVGSALGDTSYAAYTIHFPIVSALAVIFEGYPFYHQWYAQAGVPIVSALAVIFEGSPFYHQWYAQAGVVGCIALLAFAVHSWFDVPMRRRMANSVLA